VTAPAKPVAILLAPPALPPPARREFALVAIVASAGGVTAIGDVLAALPATFPVPIVAMQHMAPLLTSHLPEILARGTALNVRRAVQGSVLEAGTAYIATPNLHLTVDARGMLTLTDSPKVNASRPSADTLLDSVASGFADRAIVVILTGAGFDGAAGARAVEVVGGRVITQDRATSVHFGMPRAAAAATFEPTILPLNRIAPALEALALEGVIR